MAWLILDQSGTFFDHGLNIKDFKVILIAKLIDIAISISSNSETRQAVWDTITNIFNAARPLLGF